MIRVEGPPPYYRFANLAAAGVTHGVFSRVGGRSQGRYATLNVGHTVGDDAGDVAANEALIFGRLGLARSQVVAGQQVHGDRVAWVSPQDGGCILPATDGLLASSRGTALLLRVADCVPVLMAVPGAGAVALVHAGWKGTLAAITAKAADLLARHAGCAASEIIVGIGPSIGPCCYEVGPDVRAATVAAFADAPDLLGPVDARGHAHLDLWEANSRQLRAVGVTQIENVQVCTRCHRDEFYSHRGDGAPTGRFAVVVAASGGDDG